LQSRSVSARQLLVGSPEMSDILFLAHRIPYPPDKGDKIRAWHVLQHLASQHRVHLGTFIDTPEDICHVQKLKTICASVFWRPLSPHLATLRSFRCLLSGASLTQGYYRDSRFRAEVDRVITRHRPNLIYIFSSAMVPYVITERHRTARLIVDMVDVDSEKWRQYAKTTSGPWHFVYAREGRLLLKLERQAALTADAVTFVTPAEVDLFTSLVPEVAARVHCVGNGVDVDYFQPTTEFASPLGDRPAIVFTGVMDYRPNVEAMTWFVRQVMPLLRGGARAPCLWIVGSNPSRSVRALAGPDVRVTGRVPDIRPYLRHAGVVVAPLRIARGIQNKVLEAMAMGATVVVTPEIRKTLGANQEDGLLTAATQAEFAEAIIRSLDGNFTSVGVQARSRIVGEYRWEKRLAALDRLLVDAEPGEERAVRSERKPVTVGAGIRT